MDRSEVKGVYSTASTRDNRNGDLEFARKRSEWFSSGRGCCAVYTPHRTAHVSHANIRTATLFINIL